MSFPIPHAVVITSNGRDVVLISPLAYLTNAGELIVVSVQSTSDGASTPPFIWSIIPPFGKHWLGAVVHDWLYRCTTKSKEYCDNIFYEAMISMGVSSLEAKTIYEAVKLAGGHAFADDRKAT